MGFISNTVPFGDTFVDSNPKLSQGVSYRVFFYDWEYGFVESLSIKDGFRLGFAIGVSDIKRISHIGICRRQYSLIEKKLNVKVMHVWRYNKESHEEWLSENEPNHAEQQ